MKSPMKFLAAAAVVAFAVPAIADKAASGVQSGPEAGSRLGAFTVTKVTGAAEDGVSEGKKLCYRCRNGSRPQVVIFTRATDGKVADLVKQLDEEVSHHEDDQLRVFVNVLDADESVAMQKAEKFAKTTGAKNVPFVVPTDFETGPKNYSIDDQAQVTITLANNSTVEGSMAYDQADQLDVAAIIDRVESMLN